LQRFRENPFLGYGIALVAIAVATMLRWAIGDYFLGRVPFIFYFPAIVLTTLLGGLWPGILSIVLSALAAWAFFIPPAGLNWAELLTFALVALLIVGVVTALNWACDRFPMEIEQGRDKEISARRLAAVVESSDDAIVTKDLDGVITSWNRGAERIFGYSAEDVIGKSVTILMPPDRIDEEIGILDRVRRGKHVDHYETVRRRKDGALVEISLTVSPIKNAEGVVVGASKIARDVTEQKRLQQRQQLVLSEMRHRIKNSLATIQAVATQTMKNTNERDAFIARLHALDRAYDVLTPEPWERPSLGAAVNRAIEPFHAQVGSRITVDGGPFLRLEPAKVVLVAMVLHELATNAVKYGALSNGVGRVDVTWERHLNPDLLKIIWQETGGPPVIPPKTKGFGSYLIERAFGSQLGRAQLAFSPPGLSCTLEIAL
jgi:two-component system CheB/CheR fusion protein